MRAGYILDLQRFNPHSRTGSDNFISEEKPRHSCFNPHSRTGSDNSLSPAELAIRVSIHTPVPGVTAQAEAERIKKLEFQSTLPYRE